MLFDIDLPIGDKRRLAFLRVRDTAFDAVTSLWKLRKAEGMSQKDIGDALDRDPAWVSRNLSGPANWTMKTFGEFVEALNGYATISVVPKEHVPTSNYNVYLEGDEDMTSVLEPAEITLTQSDGTVVVNVELAGDEPVEADKVLAYAR